MEMNLTLVLMILPFITLGQAIRKKKPPMPDPFDGQYTKEKPKPVDPLPSAIIDKIKELAKVKPVTTSQQSHVLPPPELLKKLERVNNMADFMREFNVRDVKQKFVGKESGNYMTIRNNYYSVKLASDGHVMNNKHRYEATGKVVDMVIPASTKCLPRYKLTKIERPTGTYMNWPSCVYAKQCGGCCVHDNKECVPTKMEKKQHTIFRIPYHNDPYAEEVDVFHHLSCECQCSVKESDCVNRQVFDRNNCQCTCPDAQMQQCPRGKHWSRRACACECADKKKHCSSDREFWDEENCECRCKKKSCPQGQVQDKHTCICVKVN